MPQHMLANGWDFGNKAPDGARMNKRAVIMLFSSGNADAPEEKNLAGDCSM